MRKTPDKRVNSTPNLGSRASQILQNLLFATSALAATACDNPDSRSENEGDNLSTITSPLVLQAAPRNIEGLPANPVSVNFISINGVNYAFVIVDEPRFPGAPEGLFELYREVDGRFERSQIIGFDEGRAFAEEIMFLQGEAGFGRFMMRSGGALYMFESFVNDQGNIQIVDPNGSPVLDPENPGVGLGFSDIKVISNSRDFLARSGSTLYIINSNGIARVLGEVTPQIANHLFSKGLPSIRLNADGTMSFALPGAEDQITRRTEIRINDVAAGTNIINGITGVLLDGEPLVFGNRNVEARDPQFAPGGSNEMTFISFDGTVQVVTLEAPIIPPVDAALPDAAAEDAGVDAAAEQDAATPDAGAVDAEVSPADSSSDAELSQPDAQPADASVSPDMNQSDATPDGGMVEEDSAIPDQGVDMAADRGVEQPPVCGDSICGIEESVNSCLVDCFKAFRMSEGECSVEVRLVDDVIVEFTGNGEVTDKCIAEIDVPGFADPVRYIVSFDPEGEPQAGRIEFEGVIFLGEDGAPEFGTALGRNVHTVVELEENGQQWRVGNLDGLSLAGVATKIFLVKESETDGRQVWRATNNNTLIEGPVFAFDPKGNVVAVLPPAATIRFSVQDGGETVEIEAIEQGEPEPGVWIGGAGCADADCDTNPEKGPTTPATPIALVLLALARIPLRRKN